MKLFIFQNVDRVSDRYHPGGGLVIQAQTRLAAEVLLRNFPDVELTEKDWLDCDVYELKGRGYVPGVTVFPDAGCC